MKVEDLLFLVKQNPDKVSHLEIISVEACGKCELKPCLYFCPAQVYSWEETEQAIAVAYEGCFECGACRMACPADNIGWRYPRGGCGVAYRFG